MTLGKIYIPGMDKEVYRYERYLVQLFKVTDSKFSVKKCSILFQEQPNDPFPEVTTHDESDKFSLK
jgi:hypothetical protein